MYEVGIVGEFEAAHKLSGDFGPATRTHGHTYRVEAVARGAGLRPDGTLFDIVPLQEALDATLAALHYRDLGDLEPFADRNSTMEAVARHVWDTVAPRIAGLGVASLAVRVWESPRVWAGYDAPLPSPDG